MCVPLVFFLSTVMLHSVSAGGVYCAKTARARAAALGLDYPGIHGAPDLYKPAHHRLHPSILPLRPYLYKSNSLEPAKINSDIAYYKQDYPRMRTSDDRTHKQAQPWNSESVFQLNHGTYNPVQSEYATEQVLGLPRGQPVSNYESNFEEVKHVAPPAWAETPGQPELMNWETQGHTASLPFVYNEHDLVFDESVSNKHAMPLTGHLLPQSRGRGTYHRAPTGYGFGEVPVRSSSDLTNQPHTRVMARSGPMFARSQKIWVPAHRVQLLP